jgi:hypothetical protein
MSATVQWIHTTLQAEFQHPTAISPIQSMCSTVSPVIRVFFLHFFRAMHKATFTGMMKRLTSMTMNETSKIWIKSQLFIQMYAIHLRMRVQAW